MKHAMYILRDIPSTIAMLASRLQQLARLTKIMIPEIIFGGSARSLPGAADKCERIALALGTADSIFDFFDSHVIRGSSGLRENRTPTSARERIIST
jgi:hypothetical protein